MARIDHTNCTHPRTPAGRRACRAGNAVPAVTVGQPYVVHPEGMSAEGYRGLVVAKGEEYIKMTGATARKLARHAAAADKVRPIDKEIARSRANQNARRKMDLAARIQPRRSGARVSAGSSTCVQAALHTSGRCACGWHAADFCNTTVYACAGH